MGVEKQVKKKGKIMTQEAPHTVYFSKTYDEAMSLLIETRDYMTYRYPNEKNSNMKPEKLLGAVQEIYRLTARLGQIMLWLQSHKAASSNDAATMEAVKIGDRLSSKEVCLERSSLNCEDLPVGLSRLLERSYNLYTRVARLDELAGKGRA